MPEADIGSALSKNTPHCLPASGRLSSVFFTGRRREPPRMPLITFEDMCQVLCSGEIDHTEYCESTMFPGKCNYEELRLGPDT